MNPELIFMGISIIGIFLLSISLVFSLLSAASDECVESDYVDSDEDISQIFGAINVPRELGIVLALFGGVASYLVAENIVDVLIATAVSTLVSMAGLIFYKLSVHILKKVEIEAISKPDIKGRIARVTVQIPNSGIGNVELMIGGKPNTYLAKSSSRDQRLIEVGESVVVMKTGSVLTVETENEIKDEV